MFGVFLVLGVGERKSLQDLLDSGRRLGKAEMRSISLFSLGSYFVRTYGSPLLHSIIISEIKMTPCGAFLFLKWCWE